MKRTFVSIVAVISLLLIFSAVSASPLAPDYTKVGVKLGDEAIYRSSFTFATSNKTRISIYGIAGTVITINYTHYEPNGAVGSSGQLVGDIYNGASWIFQYLVAAGLATPDPIYSSAVWEINGTSQMVVAGALRTVNHVSYNGGVFDGYWDQATGLMIELHWLSFGWANLSLLSTTAWSPPSFWNMTTIALILGLVVCVLVVALVYVARNRTSRRK